MNFFLQDISSAVSNLASHQKEAVNMNLKEQKKLATTRELMGNAKERAYLFHFYVS
ncbi:hypothetical protein [Priestia megaterium]|uniref:hypothetical protein n=1 Tax=Priestia megaterium TaxID=1404 RepID=UPI001B3A54EB|nr:hypothetical protein [Priestia megaterium]